MAPYSSRVTDVKCEFVWIQRGLDFTRKEPKANSSCVRESSGENIKQSDEMDGIFERQNNRDGFDRYPHLAVHMDANQAEPPMGL